MASIAVVGVGSIGGFFAARAVATGRHNVRLCVRRPFARLRLETGSSISEHPVPVHTDPTEVGVVEWVLLATKTYQTPATAPWLRALCGSGTKVAVLQNGVEHRERVAPFAGEAEVLPAVVYCDASAVAPGHIVHYGGNRLIVPDVPAAYEFQRLFVGADVQVEIDRDFTTAVWTKLCRNVAANSVTAITGQRLNIFQRPDVAALGLALIEECMAVGVKEGARLGTTPANRVVDLSRFPSDGSTSMLHDRLAGRPLEYDALNGAVVRLAARHGLEVPLNRAVSALLGAISDAQIPPEGNHA
ncbi:MAG TPA: 2-dehydropantoate 2-reductase [bacterium]|nr:2-dehydropantoate 2-reductase [bacterium]